MEDIINSMIDYDKQAQSILKRANDRQMNIAAYLNNEVEEMRRSYIQRAQRRIETYKGSEQTYIDNMIREIDEKRQNRLFQIRMAYNENSDKWIEDIFNSIINDI